MTRSTNIILGCVAMLAATALAYALTPRNLMARTHDAFNIDKHIPYAFGDWKPLTGVNAVAPPPPTELERETYNQEVSRTYVDSDGHVVMFMIAYGESRATGYSSITLKSATRRKGSGCPGRLPRSSSIHPPPRRSP